VSSVIVAELWPSIFYAALTLAASFAAWLGAAVWRSS
jgi:hypothetical protein